MNRTQPNLRRSPTVEPIGPVRWLTVLLLATVIIAGHAYDILFGVEHWPFSHYPMYSLPAYSERNDSPVSNYIRQFSARNLLQADRDDPASRPIGWTGALRRVGESIIGLHMRPPDTAGLRPPRLTQFQLLGKYRVGKNRTENILLTHRYVPEVSTQRLHNILATRWRHGPEPYRGRGLEPILHDYHSLYEARRILKLHDGPKLIAVEVYESRWHLTGPNRPRKKADRMRLLATTERQPASARVAAVDPQDTADADTDRPDALDPAPPSDPIANANANTTSPNPSDLADPADPTDPVATDPNLAGAQPVDEPEEQLAETAPSWHAFLFSRAVQIAAVVIVALTGIVLLIPPTRRATFRGLSDTFSPADPRALAILRILLLGLMFGFYVRHDFSIWGSLPVSFRRPLWTFDLFGLEIASQRTLTVIEFIWKASLLTAAIGLYTRLSLLVAVVFGYYLLSLPNQFGKVGHGDGILVFALLILTFSRCADAWSVDRLLARRRGWPVRPIEPGRDYFWPIQLVRVLTCLVFFAAGYAKLANSGWDWVFSNNLSLVLKQHHANPSINPMVDWGLWIADRAWVYQPMAFLTILVELAFPLALFSKWARIILVPTMFSMQVGIALTMGVVFEQFMYIYLFWLPLAGLLERRRLAKALVDAPADTRVSQPAFA